MTDYKTIAESKNFIVLDKYAPEWKVAEGYQSEGDLEREFIQDLQNQGYEYLPGLNTPQALLANVRVQLQTLNSVQFADAEWQRFVETWLDKPSDGIVEKTRKVHDDYIHDFVFDDGRIQNIYLLDKKNIARNKVQVIKQFEQTGSHANRYDVTILVNGLPLVQVELKKRGVAIREAFNQVHRYSKESFNSEHSLYKYFAAVCDFQRHRQPLLRQYHAAQQKQLRLHHELGEGGQHADQGPEGLHGHLLPEAHAAQCAAALLGI
jgi:type I restriction enzyme R subunit